MHGAVRGCQAVDSIGMHNAGQMKLRLVQSTVIALGSLLLLAPLCAAYAEDDGQDLAYELHQRGEIHALADVLHGVLSKTPGDVVAVDLVRRGNVWLYEIQVVAADGRRTTVEVDASLNDGASHDGADE